MPFKFHRINNEIEIIVNEVGDYQILPLGTTERIITKKIDKYESPLLYGDLIANFFISEESYSPIIDVLATRYRTKKTFIESFTGLHIFVITLRCEHTCQYCQVSRVTGKKDKYDMSLLDIDEGINLMMLSPNADVTMEFQGGEALLAFDNIVYAINRTKELSIKYGKRVTYVICTNLALITKEILEFCDQNDILISTSLDGPKHVHDKNRNKPHASSYEKAISGIELSRQVLGRDKVSALMTTSSYSLDFPEEIVNEYYNQGFEGIFLRNISPYGFALRIDRNKYPTSDFLTFYKKALNRIIEINRQGQRFTEDFTRILLIKILTPFNVGFVDMQSPAGLINGVVVFNYDGKVYATDESRMLGEINDDSFLLGKLNKSSYSEIFYGEKAQKISKIWANEALAGCSDCAFQTYCGADPVHNWATQGDAYGYRPNSSFCEKNMEIIRYIFELMSKDKEIEEIFKNWVS